METIYKRIILFAFLLTIWLAYGLALIPFYNLPYPSLEWTVTRITMLTVAVICGISSIKLFAKIVEME